MIYGVKKMELSNGELMVMEVLWEGECLDENGEIQALELSKVLYEKYDLGKTSCYTFFGRLLEKGAIARRYPTVSYTHLTLPTICSV